MMTELQPRCHVGQALVVFDPNEFFEFSPFCVAGAGAILIQAEGKRDTKD